MAYLRGALDNLEAQCGKAPWQGGVFERMIKQAKRCLNRVIEKKHLSRDELVTLIVEIEATLNSTPITYVSR